MRSLAPGRLFVVSLPFLLLPVGANRALAGCTGDSIGVDVSLVTTVGSVHNGEALGETFLASDTQIQSITVWRAAHEDTNVFGMRIFITGTDSTGSPRSTMLLRDGPTVYNSYGDVIHPIPFEFVFAPPVVLPQKGL